MCTEAGMYALRERRVHVTQEDFELAVAKVCYLRIALIIIDRVFHNYNGIIAAIISIIVRVKLMFVPMQEYCKS